MTEPRIERVPDSYDPRYPARLDAEDFARLVAPDQRLRLARAAAAAASLALGGTAAAQDKVDGKQQARVEAVLAVLNSVAQGNASWLDGSTFQRGQDKQGHAVVVPSIPIMFGNSHNGVFDAGRARTLACRLFVAYGLKPETDRAIAQDGVQARVDVYDPALQIGAKLRGVMPKQEQMFGKADPEAPEAALDDDEAAALQKSGVRVHCADLDAYPRMDGDEVTPTLAYLAGIVAFLDEVTGTQSFDLAALLARDRVRIALPAPIANADAPTQLDIATPKKATKLVFVVDPAQGYERSVVQDNRPQWVKLAKAPARGDILLLHLDTYPPTAITVTQAGSQPIRVEGRTPAVFLPARFDPSQPYRIELAVEPERFQWSPQLTLLGAKD